MAQQLYAHDPCLGQIKRELAGAKPVCSIHFALAKNDCKVKAMQSLEPPPARQPPTSGVLRATAGPAAALLTQVQAPLVVLWGRQSLVAAHQQMAAGIVPGAVSRWWRVTCRQSVKSTPRGRRLSTEVSKQLPRQPMPAGGTPSQTQPPPAGAPT